MYYLGLKNKISEIRNLLDGLNRLGTTKEKISKIQTEQ